MGPIYDQPRETLSKEQVDASLRYQIMEVVDRIRWIPDFGYERELDWLRNMHDWMISKKRYWGLALPIYDCAACGTIEVIGGREELKERAVEGWDRFEGHTPHRPWVDEVKIACPQCGAPVERIKDVGNPWLDAGIVPFSTLHHREDPEYWAEWFPADFITESFPGQFRNWFYSMLAMSTVLVRQEPFKTIFGYALVFGEDGRQMHKSWGNAIDFDEAAERMGVDVMRWMFAKARPEENILFGWHAADEARRELLVLWNVYAFFVTYARLAGWTPPEAPTEAGDGGPERSLLDRWILSRAAWLATEVGRRLDEVDAAGASKALGTFIDDLSTWFLRRSRDRMRPGADPADRDAAFSTLHTALVVLTRTLAPILPFVSETMYQNLVVAVQPSRPGRGGRNPPRGVARTVDGHRQVRRRAGPDPAFRQPPQDTPTAGQGMGRGAGRRRSAPVRAARHHRRGDQRQGRRADRGRVRARRAPGQGAAAEGRQAARTGHPRRRGRRPGRRGLVPRRRVRDDRRGAARGRRGGDPGHAPPGNRRGGG
jgi:isoleucyl-tRNA synthetase